MTHDRRHVPRFHALPASFPRLTGLRQCLSLIFYCLSLIFHCLSLIFHCLSLIFHCLSLTFHFLCLTFHCLFTVTGVDPTDH